MTGAADSQTAPSLSGSHSAGSRPGVVVEQGAVVLNVRDGQGRLQGAIAVQWEAFSETADPHQGNLLADDALMSEKLQAIGVSAQPPVAVVGAPGEGAECRLKGKLWREMG